MSVQFFIHQYIHEKSSSDKNGNLVSRCNEPIHLALNGVEWVFWGIIFQQSKWQIAAAWPGHVFIMIIIGMGWFCHFLIFPWVEEFWNYTYVFEVNMKIFLRVWVKSWVVFWPKPPLDSNYLRICGSVWYMHMFSHKMMQKNVI